MDIILLERVEKLGQMGETVSVKEGYARNYLLPQGKALRATEANKQRFEAQREELERRNQEAREAAASAAGNLDGQSFVVIRTASDTGALYGSVASRDIADAAAEAGFEVSRRQVELARPIKELGLHDVRVILHPEVAATVTVNVARSQEEAEIQASGKTVAELRAEEEAAAEFDIAELFDDIGSAAAEDEAVAETVKEQHGDDPRDAYGDDPRD